MTVCNEALSWIAQARSDFCTLNLLLQSKVDGCQKIHYFQMSAEKLVKACEHEWQRTWPRKSHTVIHDFFKTFPAITTIKRKRDRIANELGFIGQRPLEKHLKRIAPCAKLLDTLHPNAIVPGILSSNPPRSPNCEYPWQGQTSICAPCVDLGIYETQVLTDSSGRQFHDLLKKMLKKFECFIQIR